MKKIRLDSLSLRNFKGHKSLTVKFSDDTKIYGDNETGKSSILDAINWLLFGKNAAGESKFSYKPLTSEGEPIHYLETEVEGIWYVDGKKISLKRTLKEVWRNKRKKNIPTLTGHTTDYTINEVPGKQEKEFKEVVNDICSEEIFRLITSTTYFAKVLDAEKRRQMLFEMIDEVSDDDVANTNQRYQGLFDRASGKSLADYKTMLKSKRGKLQERRKEIPARIDEADRKTPEESDWDQVQSILSEAEKHYDKLTQEIEDKSKLSAAEYQKREDKQKEGYALKQKANQLKHEILTIGGDVLNEYDTQRRTLDAHESQTERLKEGLEREIEELREDVGKKKSRQNDLRSQWIEEDAKKFEFDDNRPDITCPACGEEIKLGEDERPTAEQKFNVFKAERLKELSGTGKNLGVAIKALEKEIAIKTQELQRAEEAYDQARKERAALKEPNVTEPNPEENTQYMELLEKIEQVNQELSKEVTLPDINELKEKKTELSEKIEEAKDILRDKEKIAEIKKRISELEAEEKTIAQEISTIEKDEYLIEQFDLSKNKILEEKVNDLFGVIKFKLFEVLISTDIDEETGLEKHKTKNICVATYKGVPYPDMNDGAKVIAGLDIIKAFSGYYDISAPVGIDNRESTTRIIPMDTQTINFYVSANDKVLRIEN